jgi:hypothetical protein
VSLIALALTLTLFLVAPAGIVNLLQQVDLQLKTEAKKIKLT